MPAELTTDNLIMVGVAILVVIWLIGLIRRVASCLIHLALIAAIGLAIYGVYTGQIQLPAF